jgi:hypothetical protein
MNRVQLHSVSTQDKQLLTQSAGQMGIIAAVFSVIPLHLTLCTCNTHNHCNATADTQRQCLHRQLPINTVVLRTGLPTEN